ncbi:MAG: MarR family transcriptional regulator [Chloroflexota bacterium]
MTDVKTRAGALSTREHPHLGVLLSRAQRLLYDRLLERFAAAGFADLRYAHGGVFSFLPESGIRLTALAERARMTKQSMGELVRDLESLGYVERRQDPADGRARIVAFTAKGARANEIGVRALRNLEFEWGRQLASGRMAQLRATLETLTDVGAT